MNRIRKSFVAYFLCCLTASAPSAFADGSGRRPVMPPPPPRVPLEEFIRQAGIEQCQQDYNRCKAPAGRFKELKSVCSEIFDLDAPFIQSCIGEVERRNDELVVQCFQKLNECLAPYGAGAF